VSDEWPVMNADQYMQVECYINSLAEFERSVFVSNHNAWIWSGVKPVTSFSRIVNCMESDDGDGEYYSSVLIDVNWTTCVWWVNVIIRTDNRLESWTRWGLGICVLDVYKLGHVVSKDKFSKLTLNFHGKYQIHLCRIISFIWPGARYPLSPSAWPSETQILH
jgi:hypothetical protein